MALKQIPTGNLPYVVVTELPSTGEENTIYGVPIDAEDEVKININYRYKDGKWEEVDLGCTIFGFLFADYQESVAEVIADFEARIEALEGSSKGILYEADNISLTEAMATIGMTVDITSTLKVSDGTVCKITLTDMTIDGEPIADVEDSIALYALPDWNWQGGDVYNDVFGNSAYFSFGTKPMNSIAQQVTLGFVNEQEHFDERTLVIGHIKVEVV